MQKKCYEIRKNAIEVLTDIIGEVPELYVDIYTGIVYDKFLEPYYEDYEYFVLESFASLRFHFRNPLNANKFSEKVGMEFNLDYDYGFIDYPYVVELYL